MSEQIDRMEGGVMPEFLESTFKQTGPNFSFRDFAYWLQGYFELTDDKELDENQVNIIKDHLGLLFNKVTIDRPFVDWGSFPQASC